jgi:hypothetical protein
MSKLGTLTWMERTGGRLAWHDKLTLMAQGVQARVHSQRQRQRHAGTKLRHREVSQILPPDSAIAREALAMAQDSSPPYLMNHSLRAYFWARLLDADTRPFDDEAVFVALMLHDLGLTDRWRLQGQAQHCFSVVGARAAQELAAKHEWTETRANLAAGAITLHLNVTVGDAQGKEAQMVRAGSGGDVAGLGLAILQRDQIAEVVGRYPRFGLKSMMTRSLMVEATERPCCRTAFLCRSLGFVDLIKNNRVFSE